MGGTLLAGCVAEMKVVCAWCRREGRPDYVGEKEPFDNPASTDGICSRHYEQFLESLPSTSFPDVELLIVVHPKETTLFAYLQRNLAGVRHVQVIMERRHGDRRQERRNVAVEQRERERRLRGGKRFALGYTAVRFGRTLRAQDEGLHLD